jgi:hypothetical protein
VQGPKAQKTLCASEDAQRATKMRNSRMAGLSPVPNLAPFGRNRAKNVLRERIIAIRRSEGSNARVKKPRISAKTRNSRTSLRPFS